MRRRAALPATTRRLGTCGALLAVLLAPVPGSAPAVVAAAGESSLPSVASGARPGPDVLYAPAPRAPQLENRSADFRAAPLLVMGTEAYVDGEYLYQDWIYDDAGSDSGGNDSGANLTAGDIDYPTDRARYGGNAADLVEVRIAPGPDAVAYRFALNTLLVPDSTILSLAFDNDLDENTGRPTLPRDPGFAFPGTDEVITTWGTGAEHSQMAGSSTTTRPVAVSTDLEANQMTIVVPRSISNPTGTWRATVAAGLFDAATGGWLRPGPLATATQPGGAGPLDPMPSGVFNLGFRFDEQPSAFTGPEARQAAAIRSKAPLAARTDVDFGALERGENRSSVPTTGTLSRIFPSRISFGEGKDYTSTPELLGQLQPYSLYVPPGYVPGQRIGLTLDLHSNQMHHWQYNHTPRLRQLGEQRNTIVASCECRGEDGWFLNEAEYDLFEMWNDVATHYALDPDSVAIAGYSMGGYGVYRLATLYPDLFGAGFTIAGPPGRSAWVPPRQPDNVHTFTNVWLENARHVPLLNVAGGLDQLVPVTSTRAQNLGAPEAAVRGLEQLGYRYLYALYPEADHFVWPFQGYNVPYAAGFLGQARVDRNPTHVTFAYVPATDNAALGLVHDHAYWVSGVELANPSLGTPLAKGVVDAFSHAFGRGDPPSTAVHSPGASPLPFIGFSRTWGEAPQIPAENKLTLTLSNVGQAVIDIGRARLDAGSDMGVAISADVAGAVVLTGVRPGATVVEAGGGPVLGASKDGRITVSFRAGESSFVVRTPGSGWSDK